MSDKSALLSAIAAVPDEDVPRLAYADWLAEYGQTDLDRATEEFIRVSCSMQRMKFMPPAAYVWISENWRRLVPSLMALSRSPHPYRSTEHREGRVMHVVIYLDYPLARSKTGTRPCPVRLDFHRGFLRQFFTTSQYTAGAALDALLADQPGATLACPGLMHFTERPGVLNGVRWRPSTVAEIAADPDLRAGVQEMYLDVITGERWPAAAAGLFSTEASS